MILMALYRCLCMCSWFKLLKFNGTLKTYSCTSVKGKILYFSVFQVVECLRELPKFERFQHEQDTQGISYGRLLVWWNKTKKHEHVPGTNERISLYHCTLFNSSTIFFQRSIFLYLFAAHKILPANANIDWCNQTVHDIDCQYRAISELVNNFWNLLLYNSWIAMSLCHMQKV